MENLSDQYYSEGANEDDEDYYDTEEERTIDLFLDGGNQQEW